VLLVILLWLFVQPSTPTEKKDFVQAVGVLLAALAGFGGLYFTWQGQKLTRENTERQLEQARESTRDQLEQARESQEKTQRLTEQGQITERFTRAIDQLGATYDDGTPRIEIRLGGIYALERIAGDSPKRDYSTVMEVLTAYVRENTHQGPGPSKGASEAASTSNEATAKEDEGSNQPAPPEPRRPTADIQAILDVLGRAQAHVPEEHRTRLDLHEAILGGADLRGADLRGANLYKADLRLADLWEANLHEAHLWEANLQEANLQKANLQKAVMPDGQMYEDWIKD
jgi:hypothetical protein